ncbi:helix-turn-helix domain-containing protein [Paenibacillus periandrae]|uniref:helix-turn-helix domain-containing protein n=1 Tax=Paenibacillus periandrae TaxID=1761741 RepID=UPI001F09FA4B
MIRKLNKISQVDFSNRIGISQATLSELEQDKYKPSVDTILAIVEGFETDVEWILIGTKSAAGKTFGITEVNEKEANILEHFDKLKSTDQDEIIDFIKLKLSRY